ncbi:hypothetical protein BV898_03763 [Hypsibius exemplaris]|uniref:G-protein coupled receptors family 1 profile domain-containing protein n=1 Tax=Hypsibius exemplaris TaxID=2072580 RepID=A0A1W0X4A7_HYPEX|nr:hypothetical protein BV898_03763 [Hypsibius exemplaris]
MEAFARTPSDNNISLNFHMNGSHARLNEIPRSNNSHRANNSFSWTGTHVTGYSEVSIWVVVNFIWCGVLFTMGVLTLLAYDRYKRLHTGTNFILCNVICANIFQEVTFLMGAVVVLLRFRAIIPEEWCTVQIFLLLWFSYAANLMISSISVYQCVSVVTPSFHRTLTKPQLIMWFVVPCWALPLPFLFLTAIGSLNEFVARREYLNYCDYSRKDHGLAAYLTTTVFVLLPATVMTLCYAAMMFKMLRLRYLVAPESVVNMEAKCRAMPQQGYAERQTRILLTLFLPSAVFCVAFFTILGVNKTHDNLIYSNPTLFLFVRMIYHTGTPVIASIFAITSRDFREGFRYLLCGRKLRPYPAVTRTHRRRVSHNTELSSFEE